MLSESNYAVKAAVYLRLVHPSVDLITLHVLTASHVLFMPEKSASHVCLAGSHIVTL